MYNDSRHSGLRVQELVGVLNRVTEVAGGVVLLAIVAASLSGLIPAVVAPIAVIVGLAIVGVLLASNWRTSAVRPRGGAVGAVVVGVVAVVGLMPFPPAGSAQPLQSPGPAAS